MQFYFDKTPIPSFPALLACYSVKELASPFRSTVPLLAIVKDGWTVLASVLAEVTYVDDWKLHFEFKMKPPRGAGRESQTDLMIVSKLLTVAIEAKWTEPRYETVAVWQASGTKLRNRCAVAAGWLELLQLHARRELRLRDFQNTVYQMLHRAASACGDRDRRPCLVYLLFKSENHDPITAFQLREDLFNFHDLLGKPENFPFYLAHVTIHPTASFRAIEMLPKGSDTTGEIVRTALLGSHLFEFRDVRLERIA